MIGSTGEKVVASRVPNRYRFAVAMSEWELADRLTALEPQQFGAELSRMDVNQRVQCLGQMEKQDMAIGLSNIIKDRTLAETLLKMPRSRGEGGWGREMGPEMLREILIYLDKAEPNELGSGLDHRRRAINAMTDEERSRLEITGEYHLGELVNVFTRGSLVMSMRDGESLQVPTLLFGTGNGVIGVLASLPKDVYEFTERLQTAMNKHIQGVGGLKHADWRSFRHTLRGKSDPASNFVDGDLIESFLDLSPERAEAVAAEIDVDRAEIVRRVEELQRLTH